MRRLSRSVRPFSGHNRSGRLYLGESCLLLMFVSAILFSAFEYCYKNGLLWGYFSSLGSAFCLFLFALALDMRKLRNSRVRCDGSPAMSSSGPAQVDDADDPEYLNYLKLCENLPKGRIMTPAEFRATQMSVGRR